MTRPDWNRGMKTKGLSRRLSLALAGLAGLVPSAQALHIDPSGVGQVLVFPYYTVNANNQTHLSVVNQTGRGKALKIRFHEGRNSRAVLEFNLYLSPYDVWTAMLFSLPGTPQSSQSANLLTDDNSCTVPAIKTSRFLPQLADGRRYVPFFNFDYTGPRDDAGQDTLDRTREGHFEIIEMGEIENRERASLFAISHGPDGIPSDCSVVNTAWTPAAGAAAYWVQDPTIDLSSPAGGLYGSALIINPLDGTMMSMDADAIDAFSNIVLHTSPSSDQPSLASAHDVGAGNTVVANVFQDGQQQVAIYPATRAIDAVTALFMQASMWNEFTTDSALGAAAEWVISFPTKYAYVDQAIVGATAIPPFASIFPLLPSAGNSGSAAENVQFRVFNREELGGDLTCTDPFACGPFFPPPNPVAEPKLSWSTNVISFNQQGAETSGSTILGSQLAANVDADGAFGIQQGWAKMRFFASAGVGGNDLSMHRTRPDLGGMVWLGLPATGFLVTRFSNGEVTPGLLANYADATRHQGSRASLIVPVEGLIFASGFE